MEKYASRGSTQPDAAEADRIRRPERPRLCDQTRARRRPQQICCRSGSEARSARRIENLQQSTCLEPAAAAGNQKHAARNRQRCNVAADRVAEKFDVDWKHRGHACSRCAAQFPSHTAQSQRKAKSQFVKCCAASATYSSSFLGFSSSPSDSSFSSSLLVSSSVSSSAASSSSSSSGTSMSFTGSLGSTPSWRLIMP